MSKGALDKDAEKKAKTIGPGGGLEIRGLSRSFVQGGKRLEVLRDLSLSVPPGQLVALVGPSGAGKSTLLHAAGLLEKPDAGDITVDGVAASGLNDRRRTSLRRSTIGFVYQYHHLLPEFSALENVALPQMIAGKPPKEAKAKAAELLERVGLTGRADHRPGRLSGGEQQRVAIARGLANSPAILLADEPTGNLDPDTGGRVFDLLRELVHETKLAALIATHNLELAARMDAVLRLDHGQIEETKAADFAKQVPIIVPVAEPAPEAEPEAEQEPEAEAATLADMEAALAEMDTEAEAEVDEAPGPDMAPVIDPIHFPEPIPVPEMAPEPEAAHESEPESEAAPEPDSESEPEPEPLRAAQKTKKVWNISIKK